MKSNRNKNASRKGLAFTSAFNMGLIKLYKHIEVIPEVEVGKYKFTDGWGEIQKNIADEIAKSHFNMNQWSAFQVRIGWYKGVLLSNSFAEDKVIRVRDSMKKFEPNDPNLNLEIIKPAKYWQGFLNNQILLILYSNGVNFKTLETIQDEYISRLLKLNLKLNNNKIILDDIDIFRNSVVHLNK